MRPAIVRSEHASTKRRAAGARRVTRESLVACVLRRDEPLRAQDLAIFQVDEATWQRHLARREM